MESVILDIGTQTTKVGLSDCRKNKPDIIFSSEEVCPDILQGSLGQSIMTDLSTLNFQMDHFEPISRNVFESKLRISSSEHPLMFVEKPELAKKARERILEFALEDLAVPAFHLASEPLMALYSVGLASGIVLASGHLSSYVSTVHDGHRPPYGVYPLGVAGSSVTHFTKTLLRCEHGKDVTLLEAEEIKTKYGCLRPQNAQQAHSMDCLMRIGEKIGDLLINPGKNNNGFAEAITRSIYQTDEEEDYEPVYFHNIVLCGGNTLFPGIKGRLESEIKPFDYLTCGVRVVATPFRQYAGWIGGSIAASLPTFKPFWITRDDYKEYGRDILHRKCLPY